MLDLCFNFKWPKVSDGIIAPGYSDDALNLLKKKKSGNYCVLQIDENYSPKPVERKVLFGMTLEQKRNDGKINQDLFKHIVTKRQDVRLPIFLNNT